MLFVWLDQGFWEHNKKRYAHGDIVELADDFLERYPALSNQLFPAPDQAST
jgi:hypothetical protein